MCHIVDTRLGTTVVAMILSKNEKKNQLFYRALWNRNFPTQTGEDFKKKFDMGYTGERELLVLSLKGWRPARQASNRARMLTYTEKKNETKTTQQRTRQTKHPWHTVIRSSCTPPWHVGIIFSEITAADTAGIIPFCQASSQSKVNRV